MLHNTPQQLNKLAKAREQTLRIAFIYDGLYPYTIGGIEKRLFEVSAHLAERGHEIHFFVPKYWRGESLIRWGKIFIHGVCKPPMRRFVKKRRSIGWPIFFAIKVFAAMLSHRFDIIDCQGFPYFPCFFAKTLSLLRNMPLFITWHECWGNYWYSYLGRTKGVLGRIVELIVSRLASRDLAVSSVVKDGLIGLGLDKSKIDVVPNGFDLNQIDSASPSDEEFDIIYVGRLSSHKNVDVLLQSVKILASRRPSLRCVVIGDGPEHQALVELADELKISSHVAFIGSLNSDKEVFSYMKASRIFVSLSTREGFSRVVIEANACGLPALVVRSRNNASASIVKTGLNGLVVNLEPHLIAFEIESLLEDRVHLSSLSHNAFAFSRNFDWSKISEQLEKSYRMYTQVDQ